MMISSGVCATCGTAVLRDEETCAEVHLDDTYKHCGVEGELAPLLKHLQGEAHAQR